jgi:D-arginine dehydrogenase
METEMEAGPDRSMTDYDIVVIGAGIAGASLAHALLHAPGSMPRLLLLEREAQPGLHSTGRSAAMFMASYGPPQARALTRASRAFYEQPPPGFTETPILSPRGALYPGWQGQEHLLDATEASLRATGTAIERLDAAATLRRVPALRADGLAGALWEPDAMDVDVHALHQGYLRGARRQGAVVMCDSELATAARDADGWRLTLADGRILRTRQLVNAAGAWADTVAGRCGSLPAGLQPKRRSAFTFDPPAEQSVDAHGHAVWRDWPVTGAIDDSWYFKPDAGQLLGSPANADPVDAHDVMPEELDIAIGIAAIEADTTLRIRRPRRTWAGLRTFSPDGELVIGFDAAGLFWLAGQGGYGIQSAAGAAALAASLLRGEPLPEALRQHGVVPALMAPRGG